KRRMFEQPNALARHPAPDLCGALLHEGERLVVRDKARADPPFDVVDQVHLVSDGWPDDASQVRLLVAVCARITAGSLKRRVRRFMASLSISRAWDATKATLSRDGRLITTVAVALIGLPATLTAFIDPSTGLIQETQSAGSGLLAIAVAVIGLIGQLA